MTLKQFYTANSAQINRAIENALIEDSVQNDVTSKLIIGEFERKKTASAVLLCKEDCIAAGIDIFKKVYLKIDPKTKFVNYAKDGNSLRSKQKVLIVKTSVGNLLAGERTALNFLQRMSGIATLTNYFVKKLKFEGAKVLHTRKTTPNFRLFELAAVKIGGGDFHRFDLGSAVMIKDNHICSAGSVQNVLKLLRKQKRQLEKIEIEVKNYGELSKVIKYGKRLVNIVMLDNFSPAGLQKGVSLLKQNGLKVEISGGISRKNFLKKQLKGVDYYSIGVLTHSYDSIDFSLEF